MATQDLKPSFSNLQLELLKLYANGISDEQLLEIKWLLGKYFAEKQLQIADINILNQNISIDQVKNNLNTSLVNAFTNYQNALKIIELEKNNLKVAAENISIAVQRFRLLNITSVELRQVQVSYFDAENRLYNALYQGKIAEAEIGLLTGEIANL